MVKGLMHYYMPQLYLFVYEDQNAAISLLDDEVYEKD